MGLSLLQQTDELSEELVALRPHARDDVRHALERIIRKLGEVRIGLAAHEEELATLRAVAEAPSKAKPARVAQ